jgi:uncharacterized GH25 family protein
MKSFVAAMLLAAIAVGHDTWVQTNVSIVRVGDVVHVDLLLGNHGNEHRDFKLAGKVDPKDCTLESIAPDGKRQDLKAALTDQGMAPKEGFWTARFTPDREGLHLIAQASDKVVDYAPMRSIKSAKAFVLATKKLDKVPMTSSGFDRVLGHALELVPKTNPVAPMGPGTKLAVQLLYKGKPLADGRVSFIPRGQTLAESFDSRFERKTDANGVASFEVPDANYYLVVAHHEDPADKGPNYDATKYSATLTVSVPAICPCCGE